MEWIAGRNATLCRGPLPPLKKTLSRNQIRVSSAANLYCAPMPRPLQSKGKVVGLGL